MSNNFIELLSPMGDVMWKSDLAGNDAGYSAMESFVKEHTHVGWTLSVFDALTESTIEIDCCDLAEMPKIVSYIYNLEHAAPMTFIGENPVSESYVVGMTCTRGRLNIPGVYKVENGKLIDLEKHGREVSE